MKALARVILIVVGAILLLAVAVWLNMPGSIALFVRGLADQRHPATFEFTFVGLPHDAGDAAVSLMYYPQTPIFGISEHYWSIIAPLEVDRVTRDLRMQVNGGSVRFEAPLSIVGLSNFRLSNVSLSLPSVRTFPNNFGITVTENSRPPQPSGLPSARVDGRSYTFDGPFALWQLSGAVGQDDGLAYSPRFPNQTRAVIWPGLRDFRAHIDLTAYGIPTFQAPAEWVGLGWRRDGIEVTQPGAKLTDEVVTLRAGMTLRLPFASDCAGGTPEFVSVPARDRPEWSRRSGLWAPIEKTQWHALRASHPTPDLRVHFLPRKPVPPDGVEAVSVRAGHVGTFRLFGACPSARFDSVAVAWTDVTVEP